MPKIFSEEDRELLSGKILDAGIKKLESKRYKNISVEEIAMEVGIAKGTFYNFFPSKEIFFYKVMQCIKEKARVPLQALPEKASISEIADCLFKRYMDTKTVYDYFTPEEMRQIVRRLPEGDSENDSAGFAEELMFKIGDCRGKPEAVVSMCNVLALAKANRYELELAGYEEAIRVFCNALAAYIVKGN
ncbi:MAG: TetR/AcrR family transcriptional regulator [Lachnoclostridium sp.]|nr:TetR/AcrR family transcriptional regulator [Muribaculaceae bacterium]MCM1144119.1 TetR/AcrR family transcriptional regulator [Lachnoclostridium sp.]